MNTSKLSYAASFLDLAEVFARVEPYIGKESAYFFNQPILLFDTNRCSLEFIKVARVGDAEDFAEEVGRNVRLFRPFSTFCQGKAAEMLVEVTF